MRDWRMRRAVKRIQRAGLPILLKGHESCQGQALVELVLALMTFFVLAFATIDFSWLMFTQMNIQDAVREAGRYAATGNHATDPKGNSLTRIQSITQVLDDAAVAGNVTNCAVTINSVAGLLTTTGNAGGPGDIVTITANCQVPLLTPGIATWFGNSNRYTYTASSTFVNEPFPPSP